MVSIRSPCERRSTSKARDLTGLSVERLDGGVQRISERFVHLIDRVRLLQPRAVIPLFGHLPVRISAGEDERQPLVLQHLAERKDAFSADMNVHQSGVIA